MYSLLFIEDDDHIRLALSMALEDEGYDVTQAANGSSGLALFDEREFDLVLLDLRLPDLSGLRRVPGAAGQEHRPDHRRHGPDRHPRPRRRPRGRRRRLRHQAGRRQGAGGADPGAPAPGPAARAPGAKAERFGDLRK